VNNVRVTGILSVRNGAGLQYPYPVVIHNLHSLCDDVLVGLDPEFPEDREVVAVNIPKFRDRYRIKNLEAPEHYHYPDYYLEVDTADDGPYDDNADTVNLLDSPAAAVGDYLSCVSDGTLWYCTGQTNLDGVVTSSTT